MPDKELLQEYTRFLRQSGYLVGLPKNIIIGYIGEFLESRLSSKLNMGSVVLPEVESANGIELLPESVGGANMRAAKKLNCIVWNMCGKKHPLCTGKDCC